MPTWKFFDELFEENPPKGFSKKSDIPLEKLWAICEEISLNIDQKKWSEVARLGNEACALCDLATDAKTCNIGTPHLDGVYQFGTMRLLGASEDALRALEVFHARIVKWRQSH